MTANEAASKSKLCLAVRYDKEGRVYLYSSRNNVLLKAVDVDGEYFEKLSVKMINQFVDWLPGREIPGSEEDATTPEMVSA